MQHNEVLSVNKMKAQIAQHISETKSISEKTVLKTLQIILQESKEGADLKKIEMAMIYLSMIPVKGGFFSKTIGDKFGKINGGEDIKKAIKKADLPVVAVEDPQIINYYYQELQKYYREFIPAEQWSYSYPKEDGEVVNDAVKDWQDSMTQIIPLNTLGSSLKDANVEEIPKEKGEVSETKITAKVALPKAAREFYHHMTIENEKKLEGFAEKQETPEVVVQEFDVLIGKMLEKTNYTTDPQQAIRQWFHEYGGQDMENILAMLFMHSHFIEPDAEGKIFQVTSGEKEDSVWSASSEGIFYNYVYRVNTLQKGTDEIIYMDGEKKGQLLKTSDFETFGQKLQEIKQQSDKFPLMRFRVVVKLDVQQRETEIVIQPKVLDCSVIGFTSLIHSPQRKMLEEKDKKEESRNPENLKFSNH